MIYTPKIEKAIRKASMLHKKQTRKGFERLPYVTHLFSVFIILIEYTKDEDVLIAGLLHDTLEDTDYTEDELERDFGSRVKEIVLGVTEQKTKDGEKLDWADRKREYIQGLEIGPEESLYVSAADKIHNFSSIINGYKNSTEEFKKDFKSEDRIHFYGGVVEAIVKRLGEDHELSRHLQEVFLTYKTFLEKVYT